MTNREFLEAMANSDAMIEHDLGTCGGCYTLSIHATVARDMLIAGEIDEAPKVWAERCRESWEQSKFWKLWMAEKEAGRDPKEAFASRGWEL